VADENREKKLDLILYQEEDLFTQVEKIPEPLCFGGRAATLFLMLRQKDVQNFM
jgi:hypothetical protein